MGKLGGRPTPIGRASIVGWVSEEQQKQVGAGSLAYSIGLYTIARLGLVVVIAAIIIGIGKLAGVNVPTLVAAVFGVLIALPLGMVLFKKLRLRVNAQISAVDAQRRSRHDDLQAKLRGSEK